MFWAGFHDYPCPGDARGIGGCVLSRTAVFIYKKNYKCNHVV